MSPWQAENVAKTFGKIISSCLEAPFKSIGAIESLSDQDQEQILRWNSVLPVAPELCVHTVILSRTLERPHEPAICSWDGTLTYSQLDALSSRLAYRLRSLGIGADDYIPLCFEKSMWMVVSMLGVMKAGAACVPLDPSHPRSRLEGIVQEVGAKLVLSSQQCSELYSDVFKLVIVVAEATLNPPEDVELQQLAKTEPKQAVFCIFTSGSTGRIIWSKRREKSSLDRCSQFRFIVESADTQIFR